MKMMGMAKMKAAVVARKSIMHRQMSHSCSRRYPMVRYCLLLVVTGFAAAGCTVQPKVTVTVNAEDTLQGRRLYDTETAFIYATSEPAAAHVAANLASVTRDFLKATGHSVTGKGLIIVTDRNDLPYIADRMRLIELVRRHESLRSFTPPATLPAMTNDGLGQADKRFGPDLANRIMLSKCASIEPAEAIQEWHLARRPAAKARWVLAVPTREVVQDAMHAMIDKTMSDKNASAARKVLIAPLMLMVEAKIREQATVDREIGIFCVLLWNDSAMDDPARETQFRRYQRQRNQAVQQDTDLPVLPAPQDP